MRLIDTLASDDEPYNAEKDFLTNELYSEIMEFLNDYSTLEEWFHVTVFKYVIIEQMSIRELERQTKIHFNILRSSLVYSKERLIKKFGCKYAKIVQSDIDL